ncbi:hypothetical protein EI94DRAFT_1715968 [Lactarius quietus]|nr:hypothetical protein EI94DRAFT_1715968 [Lactarius quietus]
MTRVGSPTNYLCCGRPPLDVDDSLGMVLRMEDLIRGKNNVQGKVYCRDPEHDKCQYQHENGGNRLLSPGAAAKVGEI